MTASAPVYDRGQLEGGIEASIHMFRHQRIQEPLEKYLELYGQARAAVDSLLELTDDLQQLGDLALEVLAQPELMHTARYLASPPISEDDLKVLADTSLAPSRLRDDPGAARRAMDIIVTTLDRERFPWVSDGRPPTAAERDAAALSTAAMRAFRLVETWRRSEGKKEQEAHVKEYLVDECGFAEVHTRPITTLGQAPAPGEFCGETDVVGRRADIAVRLWDGRLMPVECKVSNSGTNSYKRINNDAAAKAVIWSQQLGPANCVPAAVLSGVFVLANLEFAQVNGLTLFWAHDLAPMRDFVGATRL